MYLASKRLPAMATAGRSVTDVALDEFESVYSFIYARVGNRADAEDLTQQVALKALPRLRDGAPAPAVRGYLYATARSVLATLWSGRRRLPESELPENVRLDPQGQAVLPSVEAATLVAGILNGLSPCHRRVLELRFLRGYSLQEVADEMGKTLGSVKVMQLRALRSAAVVGNALGSDSFD
jgi:RNA polymerase sigma factor (sigma-70 family)